MSKKLTDDQKNALVSEANEILARNPSKDGVRMYPFGFLPNSYKWRAPAERLVVMRDGAVTVETYDQKRSHGRGRTAVLFKTKGDT